MKNYIKFSNLFIIRLSQIRFCKKFLGSLFLGNEVDTNIQEKPKNKLTTRFTAKGRICNSLIITFLLFSSASCRDPRPNSPIYDFDEDLKTATPDFRQGWLDGCETGMAAGSNSFYQMFYKTNKQDGFKMAYSQDYKSAWSNAFWYCYRKDWTNQRSTVWSSVFGGYK